MMTNEQMIFFFLVLCFLEFIYFLMKRQYVYSYFYLLGCFINILLVVFLQFLLLIPKPKVDIHLFHMKIIQDNFSWEELGMPSLFVSILFYSLFYLFFFYPTSFVFLFFFIFVFCFCCYFYWIKEHSLFQCFVGGIIGLLFAYFFYFIAKEKRKGEIKENKMNELILI